MASLNQILCLTKGKIAYILDLTTCNMAFDYKNDAVNVKAQK